MSVRLSHEKKKKKKKKKKRERERERERKDRQLEQKYGVEARAALLSIGDEVEGDKEIESREHHLT